MKNKPKDKKEPKSSWIMKRGKRKEKLGREKLKPNKPKRTKKTPLKKRRIQNQRGLKRLKLP